MTTEQDREPLSSEVKRLEGEVGSHAHHPLLHLPVFEQLKQRNVFRVAVLYVVVCWLILDPLHVIFHMAGAPEWVNHVVLIVMAVGFPLVLIFAWVFEITPAGLKPTVEVPHAESIRKLTGRRLDRAIIAVLAVALTYFVIDKFWISKHVRGAAPVAPAATSAMSARSGALPAPQASFAPPPHSIAVLPFVNLSGDKEQEYFSDGLTEELLNSLAHISDLQVAARTSSFSFKEHPNIVTVAHQLNVAAVLEGSVRRSAHTVRVTAQLINAVTGFHLWSQTYDRDLGDVLKLQTEIATAVASSLKVTLLGDEAARIELGGTRNPAALDAYLRGAKRFISGHEGKDVEAAIATYTDAIRLDPNYALAFASRSRAYTAYGGEFTAGAAIREAFDKAQADARAAIKLAPELAEGHGALAYYFELGLDFTHANEAYERALALAPGNATVLDRYGRFAVFMGRADAGVTASRHAVALDPLNPAIRRHLGNSLFFARRYGEAVAAYQQAVALDPDSATNHAFLGLAYYAHGDLGNALSACDPNYKLNQWIQLCLAVTYGRLGRPADAQVELKEYQAALGDASAYQYASIYAQWGDTAKALEWLATAVRVRDSGLEYLKVDPLMDPLRKEPSFQAILRQLKFPD